MPEWAIAVIVVAGFGMLCWCAFYIPWKLANKGRQE